MKTDALSYRLLQELPEAFFELIGRPAATARRYRFAAHELKDTAVRLDGLYEPIPADFKEPVYLVEYQNQKSPRVYSNLILKIGLLLEKVEPRQDWHAVVIYPARSVEQDDLYPYRGFLRLDQVTRVYLDELPDPPPEAFGLRLLKMLATAPGEALVRAQELIPEVRTWTGPVENREKVLQLIETIVLHQFPRLTRKEVEKMLQVESIRETRVFQEALEEGRQEGMETIARRLLAKKYPLKEIADLTGLSAAQIKRLKQKPAGKKRQP